MQYPAAQDTSFLIADTSKQNVKKGTILGKWSYLDIVIEDKMTIHVLRQKVKRIVVCKIFKLKKKVCISKSLKKKYEKSLTKIISLLSYGSHLYQHFLSVVLLHSAHELVQKLCILLKSQTQNILFQFLKTICTIYFFFFGKNHLY